MRKPVSLLLLLCVGCASIVHQTTQQVPVTSDPPGAAITVACGDVANDPKLVTPATVTVHRKPASCAISLAKEGFKTQEVRLDKQMSGWYLGNILIGGIIGLIVDAANGAMYDRTPKKVDVKLTPADSTSGGSK